MIDLLDPPETMLHMVRRRMVQESERYAPLAASYLDIDVPTRCEAHAAMGLSMATTYAYTVAALLGRISDSLGDDTAQELASFVDSLLNGDDEGVKADVGG